jgi:hypothetical protein
MKEPEPPRHPLRMKFIGDRVKLPRFPTDESRGYYYGTIIHGRRISDDEFLPGGKDLVVEWDEHVPFLGKYSEPIVAISVLPDPVWEGLDAWKNTFANA